MARPARPALSILTFLSILAITLALVASPARAQTEAIAEAKHDLSLGFPVAGRVAEVHVKAGDKVEPGQVLITLEDKPGQALIELWELRARSDVQVRLQEKQLDLAKIEAERLQELLDKDAAAPFEARRAKAKAELQAIKLEEAKQHYDQAQAQLRQAAARHEQYVMRAPSAGRIEQIKVDKGETVESLQPVARLVRVEELRVDASVPLTRTLDLKVGDPAWVEFHVAEQRYEPVQATITHLAAVVDSASDTRRTRIQVANPGNLPAGCRVTVHFDAPEGAADAGDEPAPAPNENAGSEPRAVLQDDV